MPPAALADAYWKPAATLFVLVHAPLTLLVLRYRCHRSVRRPLHVAQGLLLAALYVAAWGYEVVDPGGAGYDRDTGLGHLRTGVPFHFEIPAALGLGLLPSHMLSFGHAFGRPARRRWATHAVADTGFLLGVCTLLVYLLWRSHLAHLALAGCLLLTGLALLSLVPAVGSIGLPERWPGAVLLVSPLVALMHGLTFPRPLGYAYLVVPGLIAGALGVLGGCWLAKAWRPVWRGARPVGPHDRVRPATSKTS